jgi:hypothetical protein
MATRRHRRTQQKNRSITLRCLYRCRSYRFFRLRVGFGLMQALARRRRTRPRSSSPSYAASRRSRGRPSRDPGPTAAPRPAGSRPAGAGRQREPEQPPAAVDGRVHLGRQPAPAPAQAPADVGVLFFSRARRRPVAANAAARRDETTLDSAPQGGHLPAPPGLTSPARVRNILHCSAGRGRENCHQCSRRAGER